MPDKPAIRFSIIFIILLQLLQAKELYPLSIYGSMGGLENKPEESVSLLEQHGYAGVVTNAKTFDKYNRAGLPSRKLKITAHYIIYDFAVDKSHVKIKTNIDLLKDSKIDLWIIFKITDGKRVSQDKVTKLLKEVLPYAKEKNVRIAIYPHIGDKHLFTTAKQIIPIVREINHPNLGLCLHLYHERRIEKEWSQLFKRAGDRVFAVSVTDWEKGKNGKEYSPLVNDGGDLLESWVKTIANSGYSGDITWLNWRVDKSSGQSPKEYLGPSMKAWRALCKEHALSK